MLSHNLLLTGDDGYNLTKSLRFRSSASAYLNRTPATTTNQTTWTWSGWVKRGKLGVKQALFGTGSDTGTPTQHNIYFSGGDTLFFEYWNGSTNYYINSSQVFRDPSAWYHIVAVWDTTQGTSSNRMKLYVNGYQITALSATVYPSSSFAGTVNTTVAHYIGEFSNTGNFDGYMSEINFIDGQALTPSSFGSTNALTGVWQPARYTGTYGTNGFYLPFTNTASTTALGYDSSGNGNNWTTNNFSISSNSTYDSMNDVPTLTSATTANYATLNPLMFRLSNTPGATLSNGNLTSTHTPSAYGSYVFSTIAGYGAKFYYEAVVTTLIGGVSIGIDGGLGVNSSEAARVVYQNSGGKRVNGVASSYGASYTTGDVIGVAIDLIAGSITFYKNNVSQGVASSAIGTNPYFSYGESDTGNVLNWNFGQQGFTYTPPTGFVALNTYNLPTSTIVNGGKCMDATIYTGDGSQTKSFTNTFGFKPDLVWSKIRSGTTQGTGVFDSVRGTTGQSLDTASTSAEGTWNSALSSEYGYVSAFNSNGFSVDDGSVATTGGYVNYSGRTYVAWQWQAGQGTTSSNTSGSITSTVSVNASAGFSVVTYTGNATSGATVGHGLGVAPSMVIVKSRSAANNWCVYHISMGNQYATLLNSTASSYSNSNYWNNTSPTSTVFSLGNSNDTNQSSATFVAYCWSEIAGFSKFGSYTGNGSSDGPFIYTGFRPRFVIIKSSTYAGTDWVMYDSSRNTYNALTSELNPNTSGSENNFSGSARMDFLSNGIKIRTSGAGLNSSGDTYVYACFAENPFKNSLAR